MFKIHTFTTFLNENLKAKSALEEVLNYILKTEENHYDDSDKEDHIFKHYLNCQAVNFDVDKCYVDIAKIIEYLEYDECKDFYESDMPEKHLYRAIKQLRAEMYKNVKAFKKVYEPNLWNKDEDVLETEPTDLD